YAFKYLKVSAVVIQSKLADVFIPLLLLLGPHPPKTLDVLYSLATFLCLLPILLQTRWLQQAVSWRAALLLTGILTLQGLTARPLTETAAAGLNAAIPVTTVVLFWRTVFSSVPLMQQAANLRAALESKRSLLLLRAGLTIITQLTFILAASQPNVLLAWPILNSTALVSTLLAQLTLRERPRPAEWGALSAITAVTAVRLIVASR